MPRTSTVLSVRGRIHRGESGPLFLLDDRLNGYDTFLTGVLDIGDTGIQVRIITLDDLTVLQPVARQVVGELPRAWNGQLHLSHGQRPRTVPADLQAAASVRHSSLAALDDADLHYALTFLGEATTPRIRAARVQAIVVALPALPAQESV